MKLSEGGATENIRSDKITEIKIIALNDFRFELWINDSLSYLSINELLQLKTEIQQELEKSIK